MKFQNLINPPTIKVSGGKSKANLPGLCHLIVFIAALLLMSEVHAQIKGDVFRDFNGNGTRQNTPTVNRNTVPTPDIEYVPGFVEPLAPGVIVTAYNSSDVILASFTTTSASSPNFTIPATGAVYNGTKGSNTGFVANDVAVRLEFVIPVSAACLVSGVYDFSSLAGKVYGTSVRFLASSGSERTGNNFAFNNPNDFVKQATPSDTRLFTAVQFSGNPTANPAGTAAAVNALVQFKYNSDGTDAVEYNLATAAQIGSVYGVAYSKYAKKIFTSAFMKRHSGFGPADGTESHKPGAIYLVNPRPTAAAVAAPSYFTSLDELGFPTHAASPAYGSGTSYSLSGRTVSYVSTGAGVIGTNIQRGMGKDKDDPSADPAAYGQVGKVGLGAIEMSDDGKYLFVVNLYDRKVYQLQLDSPTNPTGAGTTVKNSWALPSPPARSASGLTGAATTYGSATANFYNGTTGYQRPFGLKYRHGKLYVGAATTGENGGTSTLDNNSGNVEYTDLWAYVWELTPSTALSTGSFDTAPVLQFPLNYDKGENADSYNESWKVWNNTMPDGNVLSSASQWNASRAMLAGIEFDVDGSMILGIRDMSGDLGGYNNVFLDGTGSEKAMAFGDLLRAHRYTNPSNVCIYELETAGKEGPHSTKSASLGITNGQGPGGGEFYYQDGLNIFNGGAVRASGDVYHLNTAMGGLALLPGMEEVAGAFMDPLALWSGGISWQNSNTGANTRDYQLYAGQAVGDIGKANGLGDIELLSENPPIEIGNRIWKDTNGDGIQGADEAGILGVILELVNSGGTVIGTVTTDTDGSWYFSSDTGTDATGIKYGLAIEPGTAYKVRLATSGAGNDWDPTANSGAGGPRAAGALVGLKLTRANKAGTGEVDFSDSDASLVSSIPEISLTTGGYGENNHTYDIGFSELMNIGNKVWKDVDNDGIIDGLEPVFTGVTVHLYEDLNNDGTPDGAAIATTTTDGTTGLYLFNNLLPGTYIVGVVTPTGFVSSGVNAGDPDADADDNDDNGVVIEGTETRSNPITLVPGGEPTGEDPSNNPASAIADNNSNLTVDFGFVEAVNLGNKVWKDANNNGKIDVTELAISGVTVRLYASDVSGNATGPILATDVTDPNGLYLFENLLPGSYVVAVVNPSGLLSSTTNAGDPDSDTDDDDDNGVIAAVESSVAVTYSNAITLAPGTEPTTDSNPDNNPAGITANNSSNLTVDFGFYDPAALPVKLINFNGKADDANQIKLAWTTVEESNSSHFEVQRSKDGAIWDGIGTVSALGESKISHGYTFLDLNPLSGDNLYRLKMVDLDATFAYSRIINIKLERAFSLNLFPNPTSDKLNIEVSNGSGVQMVQIYSLLGKKVREVVSPKGEIDIHAIAAGTYMVRITTTDGSVEMRKMIITR